MTAAYIFDLDGTLVDTEIVWVDATAAYLKRKGFEMRRDDVQPIVYGRSWRDVYADIVARFPALDIGLGTMQLEMAEDFYALRDTVEITIPGSVALLRRLAATGTPCCIVSGSPREHITEAVEHMDVAECLAFYLGASDYPYGKPDPSGFLLAAERLDVAPADCVVFEDSFVGITAAKAAGMKAVALSQPLHPPQDVAAADLILPDLSQFDPAHF